MSSQHTKSESHCAVAVPREGTATGALEHRLRRLLIWLKRTPLHPQWLLSQATPVTQMIADHARGRVLDIGCADQSLKRRLPPGCEYVGLDYPATGRGLYGAHPDIFADAARLPLADNSVDTVILFEVLEHIRSPLSALSEIARVLRPKGILLLTMPFLYPIHDAPHDYQRFTRHGLAREIENSGLTLLHVEPSLNSTKSVGVLVCLALGGMVVEALRRRHVSLILLPLVLLIIPIVNTLAWIAGNLFPSWDAITCGYQVKAVKP